MSTVRQTIKVFLCMPFQDRSNKEIEMSIIRFGNRVRDEFSGKNIMILHSMIREISPDGSNKSVWHLGKAICILAQADYLAYIPDVGIYRGCEIEKRIAKDYGIKMIGIGLAKDICPDLFRE